MSTTRHQSRALPALGDISPDATSRRDPSSPDPSRSGSNDVEGAPAPKLHVVTFGCQMNKYDSELVEGRFRKTGYVTTDRMDDADVILFNTCSVRDHAEERTWSWVGELKKVKRERPDLVVGIMGCMAQRVEDEVFKRAGHVDLVAGTRQFHLLPTMVEELKARRAQPERFQAKELRLLATDMAEDVPVDRSGEEYAGGLHAHLAVMRGCDLSCTYCVVPKTRGGVRSRPIEELVAEARWYVSQGVRVLTLLGQTVNSYGEDFQAPADGAATQWTGRQGRPSLADLLRALQEIEGLARIRLITLHPSYVTRALAEAIRDCDKVDRFLPLPAQAGSDDVLRRMKRGYTLELYRARVALLREVVPDIELGSDWIVGFCGETDEDFEGSVAFLEEQGFALNYIFKYSPRPDTRAAERYEDDVPEAVKKERHRRLLEAAERTQRGRLERFRGLGVAVFVESVAERDERVLLGRTHHGQPVSFQGPPHLVGTNVQVRIEETTAYGMVASLLDVDAAPLER
ncbi:MAG: tRNA (N6-isopentenyl adenosine(37)-C2)-methylthiotransferase MiaB [Planctomycetota bacterium]